MNEDNSIFRIRILEGTGKTMNDMNIYRMLTIDEAAEVLAISEKSVRNLASEESLPTWRPGKGTVRIPYWMMIFNISLQCGMTAEEIGRFVTNPVTTVEGGL